MITHEFLSALKDHFISKDKCHDRDGICNFKNQVNYIFFEVEGGHTFFSSINRGEKKQKSISKNFYRLKILISKWIQLLL